MRDVVVLLSGGVDSLVCAERARRSGRLLGLVFVDYGHPAQALEGWRAFAYHGATGVPLRTIHAFGLQLGEMIGGDEASARVVPGRNLILIALAVNAAAAMGGREVWIGSNGDDCRDYPDCRPAFTASASAAAKSSCGVRVVAPLASASKMEIVCEAQEYGLSQRSVVDCYAPVLGARCGACACCIRSDEAWRQAGKR